MASAPLVEVAPPLCELRCSNHGRCMANTKIKYCDCFRRFGGLYCENWSVDHQLFLMRLAMYACIIVIFMIWWFGGARPGARNRREVEGNGRRALTRGRELTKD